MAGTSYFLPALSEFFSEYLPKTKGLSANTIRSYKYAFRLLLEYVHAKQSLLPARIEFRHLEKGTAEAWLQWLCTDRGCSAATRNLRLSALVSFARFAIRKDFCGALAFCSEIERMPKKKNAPPARRRFISRGMRWPCCSACRLRTPESEGATK